MKEAIRALETGDLAQVGLIAFFAAFVLIVAYTFTLSKKRREDAKHLPFDDAEEIDRFPREPHHHAANGSHA